MTARRRITVAALLVCFVVSGCHSTSNVDEAEDAAPAPSAVRMAVTAEMVAVAPIRSEMRLLGTTVALRHITLRSPVSGRVLGFDLQTGDRVRRGEVVAHVISREVEAAESGLAIAQRLDPAEADQIAGSVKRHLHGGGVAVTAPEDAIVAQRLVSSGQIVAELDPLADFIDPRSIYIEAEVPVDELAAIRPGMSVTVTSPLSAGVHFPARVAALPPSLSRGGSTAPVRVDFTGPERIAQAGAPVELELTKAYVPDAIVIPAAALFQDAATDAYYVFVATSDRIARRRPVTIGVREQNRVQVTSGLHPGELVIMSGGYALSDGLKLDVTVAQN